jgi:hypothetical protein
MKKLFSLLTAAILLISAGCAAKAPSSDTAETQAVAVSAAKGGTASAGSSAVAPTGAAIPVAVSDDDRDSAWDEKTATKIALGSPILVDGAGASVHENIVTVSAAGTYVISGTLADGQVVVDASKEDEVQLVLNGAQIANRSGAAIYAPQCDNLKITLADGTQNTLSDGGSAFVYADAANEEPNAALFSKDSLSINGNGALAVNAGFNNGIGTKDNLAIVSGSFAIHAANHGIRGNDSVAILGGDFSIAAGNDGIQTSSAEESGALYIEGGTFKITAGHDGIQSENGLLIAGGAFNIQCGGSASAAIGASDSYKGLKAAGDMDISAGTFAIDSADDAIHSNGNIAIRGGSFALASGDDGIHADSALAMSGGSVNVAKSYEGLEGAIVHISAGTLVVHSADDGINAAGGANGGVGGGRYGNDQFASGGAYGIAISGGEIALYTTSDGIDSNGTLEVTGGTVAVLIGATRDGDATDVDSGGSIMPALYGAANLSAGTKIAVGSLWSLTLESNVASYCLMVPGVVNGQSYKVTANGTALATLTATTSIQGMMGGGNAGGMGGRPKGVRK